MIYLFLKIFRVNKKINCVKQLIKKKKINSINIQIEIEFK